MVKRVLMIGLDGANPYLIEKWQADLPNLGRLMQGGAWGILRSTIPHYTLPAWQSMLTGVNPGKLGIFGFRKRLTDEYRFGFHSLLNSPAATVWQLLNHANHDCCVVGIPGTYPPQKLKGLMVSGFPAPANDGRLIYTYPSSLSRELDQHFETYELQVYEPYRPGFEADFIQACKYVARQQWQAAQWLAETHPWKFFSFVSLTIDRASHYLWRFLDPDHPAYDSSEAQKWQNAIHDIYCSEDELLGKMLEILNTDDLIIIASDHGFGPLHRTFQINEWLRRNGYLQLSKPLRRKSLLGLLMTPIVNFYQNRTWVRRILSPLRKTAARDKLMTAHHIHKHGQVRLENAPVEWKKTKAYSLDQHRVYLNLQGREPNGTIPPTTYEKEITKLENMLKNITDDKGRIIPAIVYRGRSIYHGQFKEAAPDLLVFFDDYRCDVNIGLGETKLFKPSVRLSGTHHPDGFILLNGPGVNNQYMHADILDVAPTILHALEAPLHIDMDGQPMWGAFSENSDFRQRPEKFIDELDKSQIEYQWSAEEEEDMMERLQDLGYM